MNDITKINIIDTKKNENEKNTYMHFFYENDCGALDLSELKKRYNDSFKYKKDIVLNTLHMLI